MQKNASVIKSKNENISDKKLLIIGDLKFRNTILNQSNLSIAFDTTHTDINRINLQFIKNDLPDFILFDISIPFRKSYTLLHQLKFDPIVWLIPFIIFSSKRSVTKLSTAINPDVDEIFVKPIKWYMVDHTLSELAKRDLMNLNSTLSSVDYNHHHQIKYETSDKQIRVCLHELRNQLCAINAHSDLFLKKMKPNAVLPKKEYDRLKIINEASLNIEEILDKSFNIKNLNKNDSDQNFTESNINDIVKDTLKSYEPLAAEKQISIETSLDENLPYTMSDQLSIKQAIGNYLSNAIKFSPDDTTVMISTKVENGKVRLETQDEGPSITDEERDKLFLENAKLSNKPTGNEPSAGLGLSIVKELIEDQGGQVGAEFPNRKGSIFWFELPTPEQVGKGVIASAV